MAIEDCEVASRALSPVFDVEDPIDTEYRLEVSSPGLDRKLTRASEFERFIGSRVKLTTRQPLNGNRFFEGKLESFQNGKLTLDLSAARKKKDRPAAGAPQTIEVEFANVEKANLVPEI